MVKFKLICNESLLFAEEFEDDNINFEGTISDWENCFGGLDLVCDNDEEKLHYIRDWANDRLDSYMKVID